jgi:transketolase
MPSWELFEQQDEDYQDDVLPEDLPTVSVEAGVSMGWERWADEHVSIERFGASAPGTEVLERFGFTPQNVAKVLEDLMNDLDED